MKRFAFALLAALLLCLMAGNALAAPTTLYVDGVDAIVNPSGDGWSYADGMLTLNNANISNAYSYTLSNGLTFEAGIYFEGGDLTIELIGDNSVQIAPESNHSAKGIESSGNNRNLNITGDGSLTIGFTSDSSRSLCGCDVTGRIDIGTGSDEPKVYITTGNAEYDSVGFYAYHFELKSGFLSINVGSSELEQDSGITTLFGAPKLRNGTLMIQGEHAAFSSASNSVSINDSEWYWRTDANAAWNSGAGDTIDLEESEPTHFEWTSDLIDVTAVAGEGGSVSGEGSYAMHTNPSVTLTATPDAGYKFVKWQNAAGETVSTDAAYTFIATDDVELTAVFELLPVASDIPQTGDDSNVILWSALACISVIGMMTLAYKRKEA